MTFYKKYYIGYLVFVLLLLMVYVMIPSEYGFYALMGLTILFCLYQFMILRKKSKSTKNN
ncbi:MULTISPECIES: hypothetical protein [Bacillus]|uniref:hypothetical protein n=1 Tax=Bacillus TaxID=1386 RepID=UPI00101D9C39|nr:MULTISPECIES: hypothetical protein [Bacillus]MCP1158232.1 hypothetical protein [Bacillus infantis]MDT0159201.1 hypothetical protein [Bacillus sp. AG4(2022)]RYI30378.1 hypothetical protein EVU96_08155 [Bacillus infantis]